MNKPSTKIFKRGAEMTAQTNNEQVNPVHSVKTSRQTRREIVKTIAGWIDGRLENNRLAEIAARGMLLGELLKSME